MTSEQPGLISGHAKLAQGVVEKTIGSVTGDQSWTEAGQTKSQEGVSELKSYQEKNPPQKDGDQTILGKAQQSVGSAINCEGLEERGKSE